MNNAAAYGTIAANSALPVNRANPPMGDFIDVVRRVSTNDINGTQAPSETNSHITTNGSGNSNGHGSVIEEENRNGVPSPRPQQMISSVPVPLQAMDVS